MHATAGDLIAVRGWIGPDITGVGPTDAQIQESWDRLGTTAKVALEFTRVARSRMLSEPIKLVIDGEITEDRTANLAALNQDIETLSRLVAVDDAHLSHTPSTNAGYATTGTMIRPDRSR